MSGAKKAYQIPVLLFIYLSLGLVLGFLSNSVPYIYLKIILFLAGVGGLIWARSKIFLIEEEELPEDSEEDYPSRATVEQEILKIENDRDIEEIFNLFLDTIIPLIKKTVLADTVVLLLVNFSKKSFYVRYILSEFQDKVNPEKFLPLNLGLPAIVLKNKGPLIENHLPQGDRLLPYYRSGENPAKSFIATPVFFNQHAIGVLCADSKVEECYGSDDLNLLELFAKLISIQLVSSNKLYEYETENWVVKVLYDFAKESLKLPTVEELWNFTGDYLKRVFEADRIFIARQENEKEGKIVLVHGDSLNFRVGQKFSLNEGIVGWVIRKNQSLLVEDFSSKENYIPRFQLSENQNREYRSLLAVPIPGAERAWGAICLESYKPAKFKEQSKRVLETIAYQIIPVKEKLETIRSLKEQNPVDPVTGIGNLAAFKKEIADSIEKHSANNTKFSLLLLRYTFLPEDKIGEYVDRVAEEILSFMLPFFEKKHYIFRLSDTEFAVLFAGKLLKDVLPMVQRFFDAVDEHKVWSDGFVHSLTVHGGIVQFPEMGHLPDDLLGKAREALDRASEKGPNMLAIAEKN